MRLKLSWYHRAKKLAPSVQDYLRHRFLLKLDYIDSLRCFERPGIFSEEPVKQVRIFSPARARQLGFVVKKYADLEQHPELLLFIGHVGYREGIYFADRRPSVKQARLNSSP